MTVALAEAAAAAAHGDVPIGAVILDPLGDIIAKAHNEVELRSDPTAHAERLAISAAARQRKDPRLTGCTLVVTVEPCTMCAGAAVLARVERIVLGCWEPKTGAVGSLWDVVRDRRLNHRIEVVAGVQEKAAADLLVGFFAGLRKPPPVS